MKKYFVSLFLTLYCLLIPVQSFGDPYPEVWVLTAMTGYPVSNLYIGVSTNGLDFQNVKADGTYVFTGRGGYGVEDPRIIYYTYGGIGAYYLVYHQRNYYSDNAITIAKSTDLLSWTDVVNISISNWPNVPNWIIDKDGGIHIITMSESVFYDIQVNSINPANWGTAANWSAATDLKQSDGSNLWGSDESFVYSGGFYYMFSNGYLWTSSNLLTGWTIVRTDLWGQFSPKTTNAVAGIIEQAGIQFPVSGTRMYWSDMLTIFSSIGTSLTSWGPSIPINYINFKWSPPNDQKWGTALRVTDSAAILNIQTNYIPSTTTSIATITTTSVPCGRVLYNGRLSSPGVTNNPVGYNSTNNLVGQTSFIPTDNTTIGCISFYLSQSPVGTAENWSAAISKLNGTSLTTPAGGCISDNILISSGTGNVEEKFADLNCKPSTNFSYGIYMSRPNFQTDISNYVNILYTTTGSISGKWAIWNDSGVLQSSGSSNTEDIAIKIYAYCTASIVYKDSDFDGFGDALSTSNRCTEEAIPGGYVTNSTDCNDSNAAIHAIITYYRDSDGDTYGNANITTLSCGQSTGYVSDSSDCNDSNAAIHAIITYYRDSDGDTFGNPSITTTYCGNTAPGLSCACGCPSHPYAFFS